MGITQEEIKSDGQEISTIEWQELKNEFRLFSDYKNHLRATLRATLGFNVFLFHLERLNSEKTDKTKLTRDDPCIFQRFTQQVFFATAGLILTCRK